MDYKHRFTFTKDDNKELFEFLTKHNIPYEETTFFCVLEICESDEFWPNIRKYTKKYDLTSQIQTICSKKELEEAEWLEMQGNWYFDYPQPEDNFRSVTYSTDNFCVGCGSGLIQTDKFRMKKTPNWKQKSFAMLYWVYDEIFVKESTKNILEQSDLKGFDFLEVMNSKGNLALNDVFQLKITEILNPGMIIKENPCQQIIYCKTCDKIKYILEGRQPVYDKSIFPSDVDIAKSFETFGAGIICARSFFVSQKFYQTIIKNKLDKNLSFIPIKLI